MTLIPPYSSPEPRCWTTASEPPSDIPIPSRLLHLTFPIWWISPKSWIVSKKRCSSHPYHCIDFPAWRPNSFSAKSENYWRQNHASMQAMAEGGIHTSEYAAFAAEESRKEELPIPEIPTLNIHHVRMGNAFSDQTCSLTATSLRTAISRFRSWSLR